MRIVVLISNTGTGTNLQAIINAINAKILTASLDAVISDSSDALGLTYAERFSIPTVICSSKEHLLPILKKVKPDYIVLAGWKQFITDEVIDAFPEKILNLHPGIIPDTINGKITNPDGTDALWNKGMLTTVAIENFFTHNATYGGSSIHFLTHEFDFGPVLGRTFEKINPDDTIETFYKRLKKKENKLYVDVLNILSKTNET